MSTTKTREALETYQQTDTPTEPRCGQIHAALDEVEAIEGAAVALVAWHKAGQPALDKRAALAWSVLEDIAAAVEERRKLAPPTKPA